MKKLQGKSKTESTVLLWRITGSFGSLVLFILKDC